MILPPILKKKSNQKKVYGKSNNVWVIVKSRSSFFLQIKVIRKK